MSNEGKTIEEIVLAGLLVKTSRLETLDFSSSMFLAREARSAFEFISREWEEHRPEHIDTLLFNTPANGVGEYLKSLSGWEPVNDDDFKRYYVPFREARIKKSIARKADAWAKSPAGVEPEDVRAEYEELDRLRQGTNDDAQPMSLLLSGVEPQRVPWLWQDYVPLGRATLVSGDPGCGKTWFALDLAARLSRGAEWPDGALSEGPAKTLYMTVEDDAHDTIRPRIDSLGGDPSMIAVYNAEHPLHLDLSTARGLKRLETELTRLTNVKLVVIDPILDFSGGVNPNAGEEVRALLTPLISLASRQQFALVLVGHLNKAQTLTAIYRAGGSTAGWLGKCRASFMVYRKNKTKHCVASIPSKRTSRLKTRETLSSASSTDVSRQASLSKTSTSTSS